MSNNSMLKKYEIIDRKFQERDIYPYNIDIQVRFSDLDLLGHVNNVSMAQLFENARVNFNKPFLTEFRKDGVRVLIGSISLNYLNESHFGSDISFYLGIGYIGTASWNIHATAYQKEKPVLTTYSTMVYMTNEEGACAIPDSLRNLLKEWQVNI